MSKILLYVLIIFTLIYRVFAGFAPDLCRIIFLDVGQGDSALIQCNGKNILIDTGPDDSVLFKLGHYLLAWDRTIDLLILTHAHADHIAGLSDLVGKYDIKSVWINEVGYKSIGVKAFMKGNSNKIVSVCDGYTYQLSKLTIKVHSPPCNKSSDVISMEKSNINNASVVVSVNNDEKEEVLFMGDAEKELEQNLIGTFTMEFKKNIKYLKAGHHCSNTSSSESFLKKVSPLNAICSVGEKNIYGHPGKNTIEMFKKLQINYFLTYYTGDIVLSLDK